MTAKDSEIIQLALDKYLGTEDQWCQRAWAKNHLHEPVDELSRDAVSHCAEGAIQNATFDLLETQDWVVVGHTLSKALAEYFRETHPDLAKGMVMDADTPAYNDHSLMTYEGVRAAMEKYRAALEEQGR